MNDVFISYSTKDQAAKDELCAFLDQHKISYWLDENDLEIGQDIGTNLKNSLREARYTLMLVSDNSLKSGWVGMEAMFRLMEEEVTDSTRLVCIVTDTAVFDIKYPIVLQQHFRKKRTEMEALRAEMLAEEGDTKVYDIEIHRLASVNPGMLMEKIRNHLSVVLSDPARKQKDLEKLQKLLKKGYTSAKPSTEVKAKNFVPSPATIEVSRGESLSPPPKGNVLYKIPPRMQLLNSHRCVIRVANTKEALLRDLDFPAAEASIQENVRIADEMEVIIRPSEHFEIKSLNSSTTLVVEDGEPTEWEFDVRPLSLGTFPLDLVVSAVLPKGRKEVVLTVSVKVVTEAVPEALEFEVAEFDPEVKTVNEDRKYKLGNIIRLLTMAFNADNFDLFVLGNFEEVHRGFTNGMAQETRILKLVTYARDQGRMDLLLSCIRNENGYQFKHNGPYY